MTRGFDPFEALRALTLLVILGFLAVRLAPSLRRHAGRLGLALITAYLLGGAAIFAAAWLSW